MKILFALITLSLNVFLFSTRIFAFEKVVLTFGDPEKCAPIINDLSNNLQWSLTNFPEALEAGNELSFDFSANKKFFFSSENWSIDESSAALGLGTFAPHRRFIPLNSSTIDLKRFFFDQNSPANSFTMTITQKIPSNVEGDFVPYLTVVLVSNTLVRNTYDWCVINAFFGKNINIHSEHPDMTPPLLRGLSFNKDKYNAGDIAEIRFTFSERLLKPESSHIEFINIETADGRNTSFPEYGPLQPLELLENGDYLFKVKIPTDIKSGKYVLTFFNRYDIYENFKDAIGRSDEEEKKVATQHPLIVNGN